MGNSQWHDDQAQGEAALRRIQREAEEMPRTIEQLRALVLDMWTKAEWWSGPAASSHCRSDMRERAKALGVNIP